jgi:eukaryotic-like serine/threonine-protein kinase
MSLEGQQLGRYRLLQLLGIGGMGEVYLAEDPSIDRQVAIKVVRTEIAAYPGAESSKKVTPLFQREAKAISMLDHPNILPLYDYGEQSVSGGMLTYLVMPYREEGSLAKWLQKGGSTLLSLQSVEQMVQQAAAALQYAHDHQIVHQDVKPSNFLIRSSRENPKRPDLLLTDFGIAKLSMLTTRASQSIRGTPTYMAPEQWEGHPVPATDQYALAVMVYELLTGRPPFHGSPMQMMYAHVNTSPEPPSHLNPRLSSAIDTAVLRGLAKRSEERFPSIIAFAFGFRQALRSMDPLISVGASSPNWSIFNTTPNTFGSGAQYSTLAISEEEARTGSSRTLMLPNGRQVRIKIPAGVRDGQVISVLDQSEPTSSGGSAERVRLTLSIARETNNGMRPLSGERITMRFDPATLVGGEGHKVDSRTPLPLKEDRIVNSARGAANVSSSQEGIKPSGAQSAGATPAKMPVSSSAGMILYRGEPTITGRRRKSSRGSIMVLVVLVSFLLAGSAGLFYYVSGRHSTVGSEADATARADVTANGKATARTIASATAGAQKNATATQIASNVNPYPPYTGSLVLHDPLTDNSHGRQWQLFSDSATGNSCHFGGGAYHVIDTPHFQGACFATATDYSNFTYQVEMTFVRAGQSFDAGGIAIRGSGNNYYFFEIFESGRYAFNACIGNDCNHTLAEGLTQGIPSFRTGLNQSNTIAIVANGNSFDLYVNGQHVAGPVSDPNSISSHGMIGVYGVANDATTEVVYRNVKVWV